MNKIVKIWRDIFPAVSIACLILSILLSVYNIGYAVGHSRGFNRMFEIWEVDIDKPYKFYNIKEVK